MSNVVALRSAKRARPTIVNRKVMPKRVANDKLRSREYLTPENLAGTVSATEHCSLPLTGTG